MGFKAEIVALLSCFVSWKMFRECPDNDRNMLRLGHWNIMRKSPDNHLDNHFNMSTLCHEVGYILPLALGFALGLH